MISKLVKDHLPEWVEAGTILMGVFVAAIFSAGITYYKVDLMTQDVSYIKMKIESLPALTEKVRNIETGSKRMQGQIDYLFRRGYNGEKRSDESFSFSSEQTAASL